MGEKSRPLLSFKRDRGTLSREGLELSIKYGKPIPGLEPIRIDGFPIKSKMIPNQSEVDKTSGRKGNSSLMVEIIGRYNRRRR